MKKIHSFFLNYFDIKITCTCGAIFKIKSTKIYHIDVCSKCHPFFTGKTKLLDIEGRIEKFQNKYKIKQ